MLLFAFQAMHSPKSSIHCLGAGTGTFLSSVMRCVRILCLEDMLRAEKKHEVQDRHTNTDIQTDQTRMRNDRSNDNKAHINGVQTHYDPGLLSAFGC